MKNLFVVLFMCFSVSAFCQLQQDKGGSGLGTGGGTGGGGINPLTEFQMGRSNGCTDGSRSLSQAQNAWDDIMNNPAISLIYKEGYEGGWMTCRFQRAAGTIITESGMTNEAQCFNFGQSCDAVTWYSIANCFADGECGQQSSGSN
ncbi:hypothetical protein [Winogradskyella tangerina]|uniref:hypothetical protein n=1 Tax=Winogradskyella tangerina TaxID=2023240 RepID=UPI000DBE4B5F|nr:hypothetical protein [Winogradskyella tangerina]